MTQEKKNRNFILHLRVQPRTKALARLLANYDGKTITRMIEDLIAARAKNVGIDRLKERAKNIGIDIDDLEI